MGFWDEKELLKNSRTLIIVLGPFLVKLFFPH